MGQPLRGPQASWPARMRPHIPARWMAWRAMPPGGPPGGNSFETWPWQETWRGTRRESWVSARACTRKPGGGLAPPPLGLWGAEACAARSRPGHAISSQGAGVHVTARSANHSRPGPAYHPGGIYGAIRPRMFRFRISDLGVARR